MQRKPPGEKEIAFLKAIEGLPEPIKPSLLTPIDPSPETRQRCRELGFLRFIPSRHGDSGWKFTQNGRKFLASHRDAGIRTGIGDGAA